MSLVGDWGGEEGLCHVRSGGHSVTHVHSGGWERRISAMYAVGDAQWHMSSVGDERGEEELWHVHSGGRSVTHVPSGGWWRRGGSVVIDVVKSLHGCDRELIFNVVSQLRSMLPITSIWKQELTLYAMKVAIWKKLCYTWTRDWYN